VGYLKIASFNETTVARLDLALASLSKAGAKRLVLDLRGNAGGLLPAALGAAERFLSPGERILVLRRRGGEEEVKKAAGDHPYRKLPVVVLVDKATASGAEIVAAVLAENRGAALVGERTVGKGTVEEIFPLAGGWALKLTVARFSTPKGRTWEGKGLAPDFTVPAPPSKEEAYFATAKISVEEDPQLRAALAVLKFGTAAERPGQRQP
jgi:carboxyl-terminal processing protease